VLHLQAPSYSRFAPSPRLSCLKESSSWTWWLRPIPIILAIWEAEAG
jgi:hypothetical protein